MTEAPNETAPRRPPLDTIANFVRLQRTMNRWKKDMLASQAGLSLSTIERVERGEAISDESLDKIAIALGREPGVFTTPRIPLAEQDALKLFVDSFLWMTDKVPVEVAPFRTEAQLRSIMDAVALLPQSDLGEAADADVAELKEWIGLAGFVRAEKNGLISPPPPRSLKIREIYSSLFECVDRIERVHKAVCLVGVYTPKTTDGFFEGSQIGLLAIRSRRHNPGAPNLTTLWADETVDFRAMVTEWAERDE